MEREEPEAAQADRAPATPAVCQCRRPVMPGQKFDVAHIQSAEHGGAPTLANVGPAHPHCNRKAGGKRGAPDPTRGTTCRDQPS